MGACGVDHENAGGGLAVLLGNSRHKAFGELSTHWPVPGRLVSWGSSSLHGPCFWPFCSVLHILQACAWTSSHLARCPALLSSEVQPCITPASAFALMRARIELVGHHPFICRPTRPRGDAPATAGPCYYPSNQYSNTRWCCGDARHMVRVRWFQGMPVCVWAGTWHACECGCVVVALWVYVNEQLRFCAMLACGAGAAAPLGGYMHSLSRPWLIVDLGVCL